MNVLLMLAKAFDTKGYPDDKNPDHWRKINGSPVHLDGNGHIDGGAGGKFKGSSWTSTRHPHKPGVATQSTGININNFISQYKQLEKAVKSGNKKAVKSLLQDVSSENYDKFTLQEKKQIWRTAGSKNAYLSVVNAGNTLLGQSPLQVLGSIHTGIGQVPIQPSKSIAASPAEADSVMRPQLEKLWKKATAAEKNAAFTYSYSYKQFQEPLRGGSWGYGGGTNIPLSRMKWDRIGVGTMGKKPGEVKGLIQNLTSIVDKSYYNHDVQLERGIGLDGISALFNISVSSLRRSSVAALSAKLNGAIGKDEGFSSCGSSGGAGFQNFDAVMHISCPAGTKMLYMEPFAAYGGDAPYDAGSMYGTGRVPHQYWDGKSKQRRFGDQDETLIQRGTSYQCTKVERIGGKLHLYVQVVKQEPFKIT